ncbi:MAG: nucleotidyltransferase domain-containing protein [Acidobacteriota bacterium]|nr:nucleotidyltransferase domain-containing protein [Acidobacteriota bacterium]
MKTSVRKATVEKNGKAPRLRRKPLEESQLPPEAREFRRKFREWEESFQTRAKRMAYIRKLCKRIAEAYHPEKIVLFGSHAYGTPTPESDVDLLIVMDFEGDSFEQTMKIRSELDLVTPMDLLVRTPKEVIWRLEDGDMFIVNIFCRGKVMYEAKHV